jgi:hypothetical protein
VAQHPLGRTGTQHIQIIDAVRAGEDAVHWKST